MSERRELQSCAAHGLHYDPTQSRGCVLCRASKAPPSPGTSRLSTSPTGPVVPVVASVQPANDGIGGFTIARLVFVGVAALALMFLSVVKAPDEMMSFHVGFGMGAVIVAALVCLPFAGLRNLTSFSKAGFWLSLVFVLAQLAATAESVVGRAAAGEGNGTEAPPVERLAPGGNIALRVPASWKFEATRESHALTKLIVSSPDGKNFAAATEKGSNFAPTFALTDYSEILRKLYAERLATSFNVAESRSIGGKPALRFAFEGTHKGIRVKGFLYVCKGSVDFCHVLAFALPSNFERAKDELTGVVESATVH